MKFWRSKRGAALGILVLLALFAIRPGANRLRSRIVNSIGEALGRTVEVSSVKLRLLPRPGFDLENFVVHDNPGFTAEPMLRAEEVTASLRLVSLLRGRLEIARLSLTRPSLNLVRNDEGRWNLEALLARAAQATAAPTGEAKIESRPAFPYIEADHGRINFKFGAEKKPYALTEANFALWQDSESTWGVRLKAQPLRTDFNLSDTGIIEMNGLWQKAATLRDTPLQFNAQWERAQLGQVTKLAYGIDKGWRGGLKILLVLTGKPSNLLIDMQASVDDFRRYDVLGGGSARLAAQCSSHYTVVSHTLADISCRAPVGDGLVTIAGRVANASGFGSYDFAVTASDVPTQSLVAFARHAKLGIPDDLRASGTLNADVKVRRSEGSAAVWQGGGEASDFRLASELTNTDLLLGKIPFEFASGEVKGKMTPPKGRNPIAAPEEVHADVGPVDLVFGKSSTTVVRGWVSRTGYRFLVQGDAPLMRLLRVARTVGFPVPQPAVDGPVRVDLQVAGDWSGFAPPAVMGKAQLHSARAELRGLNAPLEISNANLILTPDHVQVQNAITSLAGSSWRGSLTLPRPCAQLNCLVSFDLHADEMSLDRLNQALNPHARRQPWYRFLYPGTTAGTPFLLTVNARGKLAVDRLIIRQEVTARHVSAQTELNEGKLRLSDLRLDIFHGKHTGEWHADFTSKPPQYSGSGSFERVAMNEVAEAMKDAWITGMAGGTYRLTASGYDGTELLASASSTLQVDVGDGLLPHVALQESKGPLRVRRFQARLVFRDGQFHLQDGSLETSDGSYEVSGTASLDRILNLRLERGGSPAYDITGTLTEPIVSPLKADEAQAALKP